MSDKKQNQTINAVFEGGGVKGTGLVGASAATVEAGFSFGNVAGTSAGAIVASLIAAGYSPAEIHQILDAVDYNKFKDAKGISRLPVLGPAVSLFTSKGIFAGDYFYNWISGLLAAKGVRVFADLPVVEPADNPTIPYRLQVIASDISRGKLLVLPGDAVDYGIKPPELEVALAVRMSMSLPYFYRPVKFKDSANRPLYVVDGGILSNFPVWILDNETDPKAWPTFGYKLVDPNDNRPHSIFGPVTFFAAMFETMMEAHDARYIEDADFMRTIPIPTLGVGTVDFGLSQQQKDALFLSGQQAGKKFFNNWDVDEYKKKAELMKSSTRTSRLS